MSLRGQEAKWALHVQTHRYTHHTHMITASDSGPCLPSPPTLPQSPFILCFQSVMLRVTSHKCQCHRGTVINFGVPGKMSSRCLFGLSFPPPRPPCYSLHDLESWVESGKPPSSILHPPHTHMNSTVISFLLAGGEEGLIVLSEGYLNWQRSSLLIRATFCDPHHHHLCDCLFSVCCWCMMGEVLTQHWGAVTLHCQCGWLAYHSQHLEEMHHHSRQGFPGSHSVPSFIQHLITGRFIVHSKYSSFSVIYNKRFPLFLVQSEQLDYLYESTPYNMHWTANPTSQTRARTPLFSPGRKADRAISLHYSFQLTQQRKWNTKWQMCFGFPTVWYQVW